MTVSLFIKCILIAVFIAVWLGILLLYINDVKIFNRPKVGDIWQIENLNPFDKKVKQLIILEIKKNKYNDLWVKYIIYHDKYNPGPYTEKWKYVNKTYSKKVTRVSERELENIVKNLN